MRNEYLYVLAAFLVVMLVVFVSATVDHVTRAVPNYIKSLQNQLVEQRTVTGGSIASTAPSCIDSDGGNNFFSGFVPGTVTVKGIVEKDNADPLNERAVKELFCIGDKLVGGAIPCRYGLTPSGDACKTPAKKPQVMKPLTQMLMETLPASVVNSLNAGTERVYMGDQYMVKENGNIVTKSSRQSLAGTAYFQGLACNNAYNVYTVTPKSVDHAVPANVTWVSGIYLGPFNQLGYNPGPVRVELWGLGEQTTVDAVNPVLDSSTTTITFTSPQLIEEHWGALAIRITQPGNPGAIGLTFPYDDGFVTKPGQTLFSPNTTFQTDMPLIPPNIDVKLSGYVVVENGIVHTYYGDLNQTVGLLVPRLLGGNWSINLTTVVALFNNATGIALPDASGCANTYIAATTPSASSNGVQIDLQFIGNATQQHISFNNWFPTVQYETSNWLLVTLL